MQVTTLHALRMIVLMQLVRQTSVVPDVEWAYFTYTGIRPCSLANVRRR
jgi:hypothetical protein